MSEIKTYKSHDIAGQPWPDTSFVTEKDHESDCQRRIDAAVSAERERWEPCIQRLTDVIRVLDTTLGDTDPSCVKDDGEEMSENDIRDEYPLIWCSMQLNSLLSAFKLAPAPDTRADRLLAAFRPVVDAANWLVKSIEAHDITSLSCDRDGETYCECLRQETEKTKQAIDAYEKAKEGQ